MASLVIRPPNTPGVPETAKVVGDITGSGQFNDTPFNTSTTGDAVVPGAPLTVDQAMAAVSSAETALKADQDNVKQIQAAILAASAPLQAAQLSVTAAIIAYNNSVDDAVVALTASKVGV